MNPTVTIPREKLAELLRASGSILTPEQYIASLQAEPGMAAYRKYPSRAWVALFSKCFLLLVAVLGVITVPFGFFDLENIIIVIGLVTVTFFEYRVHRYFCENDPRAPDLGFRNQSYFAGAIVIYCLYHAFARFSLPPDAMTMVEQNNLISQDTLRTFVRLFYLGIGVLAGGSQFGLAWYYRSARVT